MLTHSEIGHLTVPEQLFSYANAYRSSSAVLCEKFESDATFCTWPNAAVVLMLAAHAVELFLKGALLKRNVKEEIVWSFGHKINKLAAKYRETIKGNSSLTWDIPFASTLTETEWIARMQQLNPAFTKAELKAMRKAWPDPSILYRYPVTTEEKKDKNGKKGKKSKEWPGLYGFHPPEFSQTLAQVERDFDRIRSHLNKPASR